MRDFIAEYYNESEFDGFSFGLNGKYHLEIASFKYSEGEVFKPKDLGYKYHILIYQEDDKTRNQINVELFDAIIGDPVGYVENLIKCDWFGMICKQSSVSLKPIENIYKSILGGSYEICKL
jgi:hypothetical protein